MALTLPRIWSYGQYSSENYGANCMAVAVGPLTVWYSYRTPVAFEVGGHPQVVHENDWGPTTGKHLNWINSDKSSRVDGETFQRLWSDQVEPLLRDEPEPEPSGDFSVGLVAAVESGH